MGLEGVEIVMEVEDEFSISIPDDDCARIQTIGDMASYVIRAKQHRAPSFDAPSCRSARAFYALRRQMMDVLGVDRSLVRPRANVVTLLPRGSRRRFWTASEQSGMCLPALHTPGFIEAIIILSAGAIGILMALSLGIAVAVLWIPIASVFAVAAHRRLGTAIPASYVTLGDLARGTWFNVDYAQGAKSGTNGDQAVLEHVIDIVAENLGVSRQQLTPATRFDELF